jgi:hypothetical protein
MTRINVWECYTYVSAAKVLGVPTHRLRYAVESGYLPKPGVRFKRRALFAPGQIEWMQAYFANSKEHTQRSLERDRTQYSPRLSNSES